MRTIQSMAVAIIAAATMSSVADAKWVNKYQHWQMGRSGYREKAVAPNSWEVKGLGARATPVFMEAMVYHRAAILAQAAGFSRFYELYYTHICYESHTIYTQIDKGPGVCDRVLNQEVRLRIVGTQATESEVACAEHRPGFPCKTYAVADVLAQYDPVLGLTPEDDRQELAEAQQTRK